MSNLNCTCGKGPGDWVESLLFHVSKSWSISFFGCEGDCDDALGRLFFFFLFSLLGTDNRLLRTSRFPSSITKLKNDYLPIINLPLNTNFTVGSFL